MLHPVFSSNKLSSNPFSLLTVLAVGLALIVIFLGAYTRLSDAGLSCPDWPNCFGYLTVPHTANQIQMARVQYPGAVVQVNKAWIEMMHRYTAGIEGIVVLVLASILLFKRCLAISFSRQRLVSGLLISLLVGQVLLGRLTVTAKLKPVIVLAHLLTGLSLLGILWFLFLCYRQTVHHVYRFSPLQLITSPPHGQLPSHGCLLIGCGLLMIQIMLGGWVSTHYAGLACLDFPYCHGKWFPSLDSLNSDLVTIHMLHRLGAVITLLYEGCLGIWLLQFHALRGLAGLLLMLLLLQAIVGVMTILWLRPIWLAWIHHIIAAGLLLVMIALMVRRSCA